MVETRWSAYDSLQSYLTTELNTLNDNTNVLGGAIDFTASGTDRKLYMDIEVYLPSVALTGNPAIYIWLLARVDGTNFEDGAVGTNPARAPDAIIPLRAATANQRVVVKRILTTPDQAKILIQNQSGAALAGTLNTLKYRIYSEEFL